MSGEQFAVVNPSSTNSGDGGHAMRSQSKFRNVKMLVMMARKGVTTVDLAEKAGVCRATVSRLLCRRCDASSATLARLSKALDCSPEDIVENEEAKQ
jgi:DNA-binding Xre family transcriptional regulator